MRMTEASSWCIIRVCINKQADWRDGEDGGSSGPREHARYATHTHTNTQTHTRAIKGVEKKANELSVSNFFPSFPPPQHSHEPAGVGVDAAPSRRGRTQDAKNKSMDIFWSNQQLNPQANARRNNRKEKPSTNQEPALAVND